MKNELEINPLHRHRAIGRTVGKEPTSRFGYTPIGNAIENRGKEVYTKMMILVDPVFNPNFAGQISSATKLEQV